jgi:hypothetical protein
MLVEFLLAELLPKEIAPEWMAKDITVQVAKVLLVTISPIVVYDKRYDIEPP